MRRDPEHRLVMDYCGPAGIPRSIFLGRVQQTGDPLWLEEDRVAALTWETDRRLRCTSCGTYDDEWRDPTDPQRLRLKSPPPYVPDTRRCPGCEAKEQTLDEIESVKPRPKGVSVVLRPFNPVVELERQQRFERNKRLGDEGRVWGD